MKSCWKFEPEQRPCFAELAKDIDQQFQQAKGEKPPPPQSAQDLEYLKLYWFLLTHNCYVHN